ncbi:L,D-transpeptidase family protein [bacterium]|nr:L,D-transpeptidase family protein [bacterium]MBU1958110.1 L,D-transpeptidase family protein [bacterium]
MGRIKHFLIILLLTTSTLNAEITYENIVKDQEQISQAFKQMFQTKRSALLRNIANRNFLQNFYYRNNHTPLWLKGEGLNKEKYTKLLSYIENDLTLEKHGLIYKHGQELTKLLEQNQTKHELFRSELQLTSLYYDFLQHLLYGEIQWKSFSTKLSSLKRYRINASWVRHKAPYNPSQLLLQPDIDATIEEITPKSFGYKELLLALKKLHTIKADGGWKSLPYFKRLELGSKGDVVIQLRKRLKASYDYASCEDKKIDVPNSQFENNQSLESTHIDPDAVFDECLLQAVKKFQKRHGLIEDGIVGGGTLRVLNITVDEKIKTVLLNIDRIKWLPRDQHERHIIVNIPEFMLHYIEYGETKQQLRVIVGDTKHPTPIFNQKISYIVLNPYWKVPEGIVEREIVPAMVKNRNYLKREGIEAHRTWDEHSAIVNVTGLYWEEYLYGSVKFPYRLMQPPGPKNALGKIKFKFPNQFAVYLHDTPTRHLFKRNVRAFSHGCVRLSQPELLLDTIASFNDNIDLERAKETLKGKRKTQLNVNNQLPIHLVYLTAGMNSDNEIEFRNDIYNYDKFTKRSIR